MKSIKKVENKVFTVLSKASFKFYLGMIALVSFVVAECPMVAYASGGVTIKNGSDSDSVTNSITGPMKTLIKVILGIMSVVGVFMLVKSIMELVNAIQQQDNTGLFHAGRGIAVALLMIAITPVVNLFVDL